MRIKQKDFAEHVKLFGVVGHVVKKLSLWLGRGDQRVSELGPWSLFDTKIRTPGLQLGYTMRLKP